MLLKALLAVVFLFYWAAKRTLHEGQCHFGMFFNNMPLTLFGSGFKYQLVYMPEMLLLGSEQHGTLLYHHQVCVYIY